MKLSDCIIIINKRSIIYFNRSYVLKYSLLKSKKKKKKNQFLLITSSMYCLGFNQTILKERFTKIANISKGRFSHDLHQLCVRLLFPQDFPKRDNPPILAERLHPPEAQGNAQPKQITSPHSGSDPNG